MGRFDSIEKADESTVKAETDSLGGFQIHNSNVYDAVISMAYFTKSKNGADGMVTHFEGPDGFNFRYTFWVTSKTGKNFYVNKKGDQCHLQGYNQANFISMLNVKDAGNRAVTLFDLKDEVKVINLYDREAGKEVPTEVDYLTQLDGAKVKLCIIKQLENKREQQGDEWVDIADTVEKNDIDKILQASSGKTLNELKAKSNSEFLSKWLKKWEGKVKDKTNKNAPASGKVSGGGTTAPAAVSDEDLFK